MSAEPLDRAHALARARPSGWADIHPCFCDKFKSVSDAEHAEQAKRRMIERHLSFPHSRSIFVCRSELATQLGGNHESLPSCGGTAHRGAGGDISARDCHSTRKECCSRPARLSRP